MIANRALWSGCTALNGGVEAAATAALGVLSRFAFTVPRQSWLDAKVSSWRSCGQIETGRWFLRVASVAKAARNISQALWSPWLCDVTCTNQFFSISKARLPYLGMQGRWQKKQRGLKPRFSFRSSAGIGYQLIYNENWKGIVKEHLGLHKARIPSAVSIVFIRFVSGREIRSRRYDDEGVWPPGWTGLWWPRTCHHRVLNETMEYHLVIFNAHHSWSVGDESALADTIDLGFRFGKKYWNRTF